MSEQRYRLVSDDDGHAYVIPANAGEAWFTFLDSAAASEGDVPCYAKRVDGRLTFTDPVTE